MKPVGLSWRMLTPLLLAAALATGCTVVRDGAPRPAPDLAPRPVTGEAIKQVLPDRQQLEKLLDHPLTASHLFPPKFGGIDEMPVGVLSDPKTSPRECAGVVAQAQQGSYRGAPVQSFASVHFGPPTVSMKLVGVDAAAVGLATTADAQALFTTFAQQWSHCDGTTVTVFGGNGDAPQETRAISGVKTTDALLTASVRATNLGQQVTILRHRALGVRVNCIVEVNVDVDPYLLEERGEFDGSAAGIARLMMDNVAAGGR
ncbi:sensor domain-containing protein [Mycobacterium sp. pUA109]|uniref:sensor domain-containing protein n=1 Tax=Mycobacterium sp. pUA109 TaxID=3238982 RepID=UPI00351ABE46